MRWNVTESVAIFYSFFKWHEWSVIPKQSLFSLLYLKYLQKEFKNAKNNNNRTFFGLTASFTSFWMCFGFGGHAK